MAVKPTKHGSAQVKHNVIDQGGLSVDRYSDALLVPLDRQIVLDWLSQNVPKSRLKHILRVEAMAIQLAQHHDLDVDKAAQAGLMHDLAKYFSADKLLAIAQAEQLQLDPVASANPHLLHADVSAVVARQTFQVQDPDILDAIRNHTLGNVGMSLLSCVVFLADSAEPGRGKHPELEEIRQICLENLYQAVWMTCDRTMQHLLQRQHLIHPRMVSTRNWAIQMAPP